jgi:hypothetical protein
VLSLPAHHIFFIIIVLENPFIRQEVSPVSTVSSSFFEFDTFLQVPLHELHAVAAPDEVPKPVHLLVVLRRVAVQVAFERQALKPVFHVIGARVEQTWVPGAFQLWS